MVEHINHFVIFQHKSLMICTIPLLWHMHPPCIPFMNKAGFFVFNNLRKLVKDINHSRIFRQSNSKYKVMGQYCHSNSRMHAQTEERTKLFMHKNFPQTSCIKYRLLRTPLENHAVN